MSKEKSFQNYFMKIVPHGYRTALSTGGGFPDTLLIKGESHFLVELKVLTLGKRGDRMLRGLYTPLQPPWHMNYLYKGGKSVYTLFKMDGKYSIVHETQEYLVALLNGLKYSGLKDFRYREYATLKELIREEFN